MRLILITVLVATLTGCLSYSTLHPAEPLRPGRMTFTAAAGYQEMQVLFDVIEEQTNIETIITEDIYKPTFEVGMRYGLIRDMDIGLRTASFGSTLLDAKYRLFHAGAFTMSAGLGVGYTDVILQAETGDADEDASTEYARRNMELHLPLYFSQKLHNQFYLYTVPRYIQRMSSRRTAALGGLAIGSMFGSKLGFVTEYSHFWERGSANMVSQFLFGLVYNFDEYYSERFRNLED